MHGDFIDELIEALDRIGPLDHDRLKEVLILSGLPEETQNLRFLAPNRQVLALRGANIEFSAVAVINNRRVADWRLQGWRRALSRLGVHPSWGKGDPLDVLLDRLRADPGITKLMAGSPKAYTLFGILRRKPPRSDDAVREAIPVVALPGLDAKGLAQVDDFETGNRLLD